MNNSSNSSRRSSALENNDNSNNNNKANNEGSNKVYVWVRPSSLPKEVANGSGSSPFGGSTPLKKRGAPGDSDVWGWTPGFYTTTSNSTATPSVNQEEKSNGIKHGDNVHNFTLMPLENANHEGSSLENTEFALTESQIHSLLESGDIMLANHWEEYDFIHRLELSSSNANGNEDEESSYDYNNGNNDDDGDSMEDDSNNNNNNANNYQLLDTTTTPLDKPPNNLIHLTHLHEPSVVHALRHRYTNNGDGDNYNNSSNNASSGIYTDTGPILLAVNPFMSDESGILYGKDTMEKYRFEGEQRWRKEREGMMGGGGGPNMVDTHEENNGDDIAAMPSLPPHVYAVADRTFRTMMSRMHPTELFAQSTRSQRQQQSTTVAQNNDVQSQQSKINQSVLVSGESGAGKTVTTKLLMGYLAKLSERPADGRKSNGAMSIERRVLESNPIMESFGNARTVRNDNSSRFGKYIEMKFASTSPTGSQTDEPRATLVGASIETYLLEKVRLVHQSMGERNYHIFYELFSLKYDNEDEEGDSDDCSDDDDNEGVDEEINGNEGQPKESNSALAEKFGLLDYDMEDFRLINNSDTYDRRDGVSDFETFRDMKRAMNIMGFQQSDQTAVFGVTAALLHASNLSFREIGEVECGLVMDNPHLDYVVNLLGITKEDLNKALCYYEIVVGRGATGGEKHVKNLSKKQAEKGVEALIKATYGAMFQYLVERINASVAGNGLDDVVSNGIAGGKLSRRRSTATGNKASIGILDIFGFESFQVNSFEQLCINYCNEALQQQFNRFVLRNEQEEYDREGIPWSFIEFPENQDVLDLIDSKGNGILSLLDDQCRIPGASDKIFASTMCKEFNGHSRFVADSRQVAQQLFSVQHYAGLVEYSVQGFVEKSRDELPKEATDLLLSSNNQFVQTLAKILQPGSQSSTPGSKSPRPGLSKGTSTRPTVGIQFSSQLHSLRQKIDDTAPHYIRCLKPNNLLVPNLFDAALIADQLRCAGVIEAVRVSRLGYPQRYSHQQFVSRYRVLGLKALRKKKTSTKKFNPAKALVHAIGDVLKPSNNDENESIGIEVGKTKVFLKRQAYDKIEKLRRDKINSSAIAIQKTARRYVYKSRFEVTCRSVLVIQRNLRRVRARLAVQEMRRDHNSIIIQKCTRGYIARSRFVSSRKIAFWCQARHRGKIDRLRYCELLRESKAVYLQSCWRRYLGVRVFQRQLASVLVLQCSWRSCIARKQFRQLKSEARDLTMIAEERDRLKQEVLDLRSELKGKVVKPPPESTTTPLSSTTKDVEINKLWQHLEQVLREKEAMADELKTARTSIVSIKAQREAVTEERDLLFAENGRLQRELENVVKSGDIEAKNCSRAVGISDASLAKTLSEVEELKLANQKLTNENSNLRRELCIRNDDSKALKRASTLEKAPEDTLPSVCTSLTADMTETDEDSSKLRDENQRLRKELEVLRLNYEDLTKQLDCPDEFGNESVIPEGDDSENEMEYIGEAESERLKKQAGSITSVKGKDLLESKINKLTTENEDLRKELERAKKVAKYDLDDMRRVNRSLREDLEEAIEAKTEIFSELEAKCEEVDALNEDIEKFAETFAEQNVELERMERKNHKLHLEVKRLKIENAATAAKIVALEASNKQWVRSEIGNLWNELDRIRESGTPTASVSSDLRSPVPSTVSANSRLHKVDSLDDSEDANDEEDLGVVSPAPSVI